MSDSTPQESDNSEKRSHDRLPEDDEPGRPTDVGSALERHESVQDAASLASIDRPPSAEEKLPPSKIYPPLSPHVLALLAPASIFGVLARLGLQALTGYDGASIFPLAWVQFMGCLVMGFGLGIREPAGRLYVNSLLFLMC